MSTAPRAPITQHAGPLLAAQAARRLGVSVKALRLYERHGLLSPARTAAGYRFFSPDDLRAARDVVALRALGLSLAQIARVVKGDSQATDQALALREAELSRQFSQMREAGQRLRELRAEVAAGRLPRACELARAIQPEAGAVSFELPWPWQGERFTLPRLAPLTYLTGPLGSGKTRLAEHFARHLSGARFLGMHRSEDAEDIARNAPLTAREAARVEAHLSHLHTAGAVDEAPLRLLLSALEARGGRQTLVIDMIEAGLRRASQEALMPLLRRLAASRAAPLIAMTRSSAILDLARVGPHESIIYCPANHDLPMVVAPFTHAAGYEALVSCLATPEARLRLAQGPQRDAELALP